MLLKCKDVAYLASDYLDKNLSGTLSLRLRWHLMLCANCRRFVQHLQATKIISVRLATPEQTTDVEAILQRIKAREQQLSENGER